MDRPTSWASKDEPFGIATRAAPLLGTRARAPRLSLGDTWGLWGARHSAPPAARRCNRTSYASTSLLSLGERLDSEEVGSLPGPRPPSEALSYRSRTASSAIRLRDRDARACRTADLVRHPRPRSRRNPRLRSGSFSHPEEPDRPLRGREAKLAEATVPPRASLRTALPHTGGIPDLRPN